MKHIFLTLLGVLLIAVDVGSTNAGDKTVEAREAFKQGVTLFENGSFAAAAQAFRMANNLSPKWTILYNIAQSETAAKNYGVAYEVFEEYLSKGGDDISESRRKEVIKELDRLTTLVGAIEVDAPAGSVIWVDTLKRGTIPLPGKLLVPIGVVHKVEIVLGARTLYEEEIKVMRNETVNVRVPKDGEPTAAAVRDRADSDRDSATPAAAGASEAPAHESEEKSDNKALFGWIAVAAGGAFLVGGGVTGSLALVRNNKLKERCADNVCATSDKDYSLGRDLFALSSNISFGIGAAAAAAGIVLLILSKRAHDEEPSDAEAEVSVTPVISDEFTGLNLSGSF